MEAYTLPLANKKRRPQTTTHALNYLAITNRQAKKKQGMKNSFLPLGQGSVHIQEAPTWERGADPSFCCIQEGLKGRKHWWEIPCNRCSGCLCRTTDHQHLQFSPFGWHDFMTFCQSSGLFWDGSANFSVFSKFDSEVGVGISSSTKINTPQTLWIDSNRTAHFQIKGLKNCKCLSVRQT